MADTKYEVDVEVREALKSVDKLQGELKGLRNEMGKTDKATKESSGGLGSFKTAAVLATAAIAAFKGIKIAAEFETLRATLKSVTGSTKEAATAFKFAQDVAKTMPFDLQQVTTAYTKMTALGIAPTKEALTSFANVASATGKSLDQFVEAVADAATGEYERLKEFGIKVKSENDSLKVNFQGVTTSIGKDAASIQKYLQGIGENQFAGAAKEQMDTLNGAWSNFTDQMATFADEATNASGLMDLLKASLAGLSDAVQWTRDNMGEMAAFFRDEIPAALATLADALGISSQQLQSFGEITAGIFSEISKLFEALFTDTKHLAVAFVDGTIQAFMKLNKGWNILAEGMSFAWDTTVDGLRVTFNSFVNDFLELWNSIATSSFGKFAGLDNLSVQLLDVTSGVESWASRMNKVNQEYDENLRVHKEAIDLWHTEISAQNKLKDLEKQRAEVAKQLELDEHNESLIAKQKLLSEQIAVEKAAADQEKAYNEEIKKTVAEAIKLADAYREFADPMASIQAQEDAITAAFEEQKISAEDYFAALDQLDEKRKSVNETLMDNSTEWSDGWSRAMGDYVASANDAAANAERVFGTAMSGMEDSLVDFVKTGTINFKNFAASIMEEILRIQIRKTAAGIFSGGSSGFAGLFAQGGYIPAGQFGIVGESGPELVSGPATVTSAVDTAAMAGGPGATSTNINIYANDASSFNDMLSRDPGFVDQVVQVGQRMNGRR